MQTIELNSYQNSLQKYPYKNYKIHLTVFMLFILFFFHKHETTKATVAKQKEISTRKVVMAEILINQSKNPPFLKDSQIDKITLTVFPTKKKTFPCLPSVFFRFETL